MTLAAEAIIKPTDIMHHRTSCLFHGRFFWLEKTMTIRTESPAFLNASGGSSYLGGITE
jgi:hypothetical protein